MVHVPQLVSCHGDGTMRSSADRRQESDYLKTENGVRRRQGWQVVAKVVLTTGFYWLKLKTGWQKMWVVKSGNKIKSTSS